MAVKPIPEGYHSVTPHLTVKGAARAIDFYKKAFGATEVSRHNMPDGSIMHAAIKIGEGTVFLMIYVPNVDATFKRAVDAGAQVKMPVADQFWGDRYGMIADPFGHLWEI